VLRHAGAFRPFPIGQVSLWLLLALLVVGTPVGIAWAVQRAADEDDEQPRRDEQPERDEPVDDEVLPRRADVTAGS
jgi:hypothetical protein